MALFSKTTPCFVSAERKDGLVDATSEEQKSLDMLTDDGYGISSERTESLTMLVGTKPVQYELYQSAVVTPEGSLKVKGGQEFGYVQLTGEFVKVIGYCDNFEQLSDTLAALKAFKYDNEK